MSSEEPSAQFARALQLLELGRLDHAEAALRNVVALDPSDPLAYSVLALVLFDLDRNAESEECARRAVGLDPELPLAHGALARALVGQERFKAAIAAANEAVRLDPDDHLNHELLAGCKLGVRDWAGARASADRALALAPDSATAHGLRASALAMTGDEPHEWQAAAAAALRADAGSSAVHALAAHAHLTGGSERRAVMGFEEALRLDPESEYARAGLARSLQAAHPLFRPLFRFFMWQERLSRGARWGLVLGSLLAVRLLRPAAGNPFVLALLVIWFAFVLVTWMAPPLANLALRASRRGRAILPAAQRRSSSAFTALVGGAVLSVILAVAVSGAFGGSAFALLLLSLSAGSLHGLPPRRLRAVEVVLWAAAAAAVVGAALISAGVHAGVVLILLAFLVGVVLVWVVRLS